jgi:MinD-like ATPase involved in chromosome partitioning or flagellar assembly
MVLINAPAGDERVLAECVSRHHDIILSVRPLRPSVLKTYALIQSQQALPHSAHFRILVSGTLRAREACRLYEALSLAAKRAPHLELSYLGFMPAERYLLSAALRGRTVVKSDPHTWTAKSFRQMADALLRQPLRSDVRDSTLDGLVAS